MVSTGKGVYDIDVSFSQLNVIINSCCDFTLNKYQVKHILNYSLSLASSEIPPHSHLPVSILSGSRISDLNWAFSDLCHLEKCACTDLSVFNSYMGLILALALYY